MSSKYDLSSRGLSGASGRGFRGGGCGYSDMYSMCIISSRHLSGLLGGASFNSFELYASKEFSNMYLSFNI